MLSHYSGTGTHTGTGTKGHFIVLMVPIVPMVSIVSMVPGVPIVLKHHPQYILEAFFETFLF